MVGTGDKRGEFYADQIICHDEADRAALKLALLRPRYVVIDFDDEVEMAKVAEARWPCAKIKHIRKHIEAERAALLGE